MIIAGDIGVAGGMQVLEPASANSTTVDMIKRFGGSSSDEMHWPLEDEGDGDENERFHRMRAKISFDQCLRKETRDQTR